MEMSRRRFGRMLAALGLSPPLVAFTADAGGRNGTGGSAEPEVLRLSHNGWMPNNERLPVPHSDPVEGAAGPLPRIWA
jgi:hypothetical protein